VANPGAVLMAVFRPDETLLERQITSLTRQTLESWHCFIGVDGADRQTCALLERLTGNDARFRVIEYPDNVGHYLNFERLTREVSAAIQWVAYCDQDDEWHPEKLERLVARLTASPGRTAVVGAARIVDRDGKVLGTSRRNARSFVQLLLKNEVTGSFAVFRPDVLQFALPFPDSTRSAVHDHWLGVCAAALGQVDFVAEPMQDYVQHSQNAIGESSQPTFHSAVAAARKEGGIHNYLDRMSCEQWAWRVAMARTLQARLTDTPSERAAFLESVAKARFNFKLVRFLVGEIRGRRLTAQTCIALSIAAFWWPRARC
jgi:glycosyltransferase involved in cell wall biosynthesis